MSRIEFVIGKGATFRKVVYWKTKEGTPINLAGAVVRAPFSFNNTVIDATVTVDVGQAKITLLLSAAQTASINRIDGKFEVFVDFPDGDTVKLLVGPCKVI